MRKNQSALRGASLDQSAGAIEKTIDDVVFQLQALARKTGLSFAIAAGRLVVDSFYGGVTDGWREKGTKNASFRRLARRADLPMSATSLYRCVAIYDLYTRLPALSNWCHVTVSHARAVLPLSLGMQESMLERAEEKRWSVAKLEAEVAALRPEQSRRARPSTPHLVSVLQQLCAALDNEESTMTLTNAKACGEGQVLDTLQHIRIRCEEIENRIRSVLPIHDPARSLP